MAVKKYHEEGYSPVTIFRGTGFDRQLIGKNLPDDCLQRWRKIYKNKGSNALNTETRGIGSSGRPLKNKWASDSDKIKYLEIENAYFKAENDFLVKLRAGKKR